MNKLIRNSVLLVLFSLLNMNCVWAQAAEKVEKEVTFSEMFLGIPAMGHYLIILGILVVIILGILFLLSSQLAAYVMDMYEEKDQDVPYLIQMFALLSGKTKAIYGNTTDAEMTGHSYDGITEYDNDMPPWWIGLFYVSIAFSVVYMLHYHVFNTGALMLDEYNQEMEEAAVKYANTDKVYELPSTDAAILVDSKTKYETNCAACHGKLAEGIVGPNLTDEYWLHGGSVNDIYKTIKYGVIEKGMKNWDKEYSNDQIYGISSYIISLKGSNPPNPKAPQGDKYTTP